MKLAPRQQLIGGALVATLAATGWLASRPDDVPEPVAVPARRLMVPPPPPAAASAGAAAPAGNPDARQPWAEPEPAQLAAWQPPPPPPTPPAPPPPPPAPPPAPMAPPLPYQMIGRLTEGDGAQAVEVALLSGANRSLGVKRGDVIDGQWRVEQVTPSGVRLTWLPGRLPQNLAFKALP